MREACKKALLLLGAAYVIISLGVLLWRQNHATEMAATACASPFSSFEDAWNTNEEGILWNAKGSRKKAPSIR